MIIHKELGLKFSFIPKFHTTGRFGMTWLGFTIWF